MLVAFSLHGDDSECDGQLDDIQDVFQMDVFVVLNVVFGFGIEVDLGWCAVVAIDSWLMQVDSENDLVSWFLNVVRVHVQELFGEFEDVLLWYGVEEAN